MTRRSMNGTKTCLSRRDIRHCILLRREIPDTDHNVGHLKPTYILKTYIRWLQFIFNRHRKKINYLLNVIQ